MKNKYKILLTCALGEYMKGTINALRDNEDGVEFEIIGADMKDLPAYFTGADKLYQVPRIDTPEYIPALLDICSKEHVEVYIPTSSAELEEALMHRRDFEKVGTKVMVCEGNLAVANDKVMANFFFELNCFNTPLTIHNADECKKLLFDGISTKQFCLKQRFGCGADGFRKLNWDELHFISHQCDFWKNYLVQEYLEGDEVSIDLLLNKGEIVCGVARKTLHIDNGVPQHCIICESPSAWDLCADVSRALRFTGNIGYDVKFGADGKPYILDINPRYTATISLSHKAGVNLAYLGFKQYIGEEIDGSKYKAKIGTTIIRRREDYFFTPEA